MTNKGGKRSLKDVGRWWRALWHRHTYVADLTWCMIDGHLACYRVYVCSECSHSGDASLLIVATAKQLAEAQALVITNEAQSREYTGAKP